MIVGNAVTVMVHWLFVEDEELDIGARRVGTVNELKIFGRLGWHASSGVRGSEIGIFERGNTRPSRMLQS